MNNIGAIIGAVFCNVLAQVMIKHASRSLQFATGAKSMDWLIALINPSMFVALTAYGSSFFLTAMAYSRNPLSIISPLMAGAIIGLTVMAGHLLFLEAISAKQYMGLLFIVTGILLSTS